MEILNENRFACRVTNNAIFALATSLCLSPMQIIIVLYANEKVYPPVLLPDLQNCTRNLPVDQLLPRCDTCVYEYSQHRYATILAKLMLS